MRYNFSTLPNKSICIKCKKKFELDLQNLDWVEVEEFIGEKRSDNELIQKWVR